MMQENTLISGKIHTAGKNFTQPRQISILQTTESCRSLSFANAVKIFSRYKCGFKGCWKATKKDCGYKE